MFLKDIEQNGRATQDHLYKYLDNWGDIDVISAMRHALNGGKRLQRA